MSAVNPIRDVLNAFWEDAKGAVTSICTSESPAASLRPKSSQRKTAYRQSHPSANPDGPFWLMEAQQGMCLVICKRAIVNDTHPNNRHQKQWSGNYEQC